MSQQKCKAEKDRLRDRAQDFAESLAEKGPSRDEEGAAKRTSPIGVLNYRAVRVVLFVVLSLGLLATGTMCVLAVWGVVNSQTAWRAVATLFIGILTLGLLVLVNEAFGRRDRK